MKLLLLYANPNKQSLTYALRDAVLRGAKKGKHKVEMIDLYADRFNPVLSADELKGVKKPDVLRYQEKFKKADGLVLIYPVWWFGTPSILEGFFDRVLTPGFAYRYRKITKTFGIPIGLLPTKKALVIETYGAPAWATKLIYLDLTFRRIKWGILKFCGIKKIIRYSCFSAPYVSDKKRDQWLLEVEQKVKTLRLK